MVKLDVAKLEQALREIDQEIEFTEFRLDELNRDQESIPRRIYIEEEIELRKELRDLYEVRDTIEAFRMLE